MNEEMPPFLAAFLVFACLLLGGIQSYSQTYTIAVSDQVTGEGLIGAHVFLRSVNPKANPQVDEVMVADFKGEVTHSHLQDLRVEISFIGHQTIVDTLSAGSSASFEMLPTNTNLNEVVVTAQYAPLDMRNSVYDITVLDQVDIEKRGANNLRELLGNELTAVLSQDNALGQSTVSLQGMGGDKVKILVDGIPVIGRVNGNIDLTQINLNNAERVEIIEGPMSVLYGSDALGGVINIITKKSQSGRVEGDLYGYYESVGQYNASGRLGFKKGKHFTQFNGGRNLFDGFARPDSSRWKQWKPKEQYFAEGLYRYNSERFSISYNLNYFQEWLLARGQPRSPDYVTAFDEYYRTYRITNSLNSKWLIADDKSLEIWASYSWYKRTKTRYFKDLTTLEMTPTNGPEDRDTQIFNEAVVRGAYSFFAPDKKLTYQMGFDLNYETVSGPRIEGNRQSIGDYAVFASFNYQPVQNFSLVPSLRIAYNTEFNAPIVPTVNMRYGFHPNWTWRLSYGRGFRAPDLKELYFFFVDINHNIQGNQDLLAETSHNVQSSLNWLKRFKAHYLEIENRFYYNHVQNGINLVSYDADSFFYDNIDLYQTIGNTVNLKYIWKDLEISGGVNFVGLYNRLSEVSESPTFNFSTDFNLNISYNIPKWDLDLNLLNKYTGKRPGYYLDENDEVQLGTIQAFHMMDISATKRFWNDRVNLTVGVKNILDVTDIQSNVAASGGVHSTGNAISQSWGRSFFASMKLNFGG
jgi:outer membrane receptor for ferrienterochelin and colicins